ncbi:DNA polymerase domain-containing protein [Flindersiella endophytica]
MSKPTIEVAGQRVELSNPDKELYPGDHLTKRDLVDYFTSVADAMVPHLRGRPLSMRRFPDGIEAEGFFQKAAGDYFPDWIHTVAVPQRSGEAPVEHVICDDAATLVYLAGQACLEFHPWLSTVDALEYPDRLVIDLDPPDDPNSDGDLRTLRATARQTRDLFEEVGLTPFVQATGGKGFHVVAPLDGKDDYELVRAFARELAGRLVEQEPDRLTVEQRKDKRGDRIFVDTNRNAYGQTAVTPYSPRARPGAPVATPIDWDELGRTEPAGHTVGGVTKRLARKADPWHDLAKHATSAKRARGRLR